MREYGMPSNRELIKQFYERFNERDLDAAMTVVADDVEMTAPGLGTVHGAAHLREYLEGVIGPIPDGHDTLLAVHDAGDAVTVEGRFRGTYRDGATERRIDLLFADVFGIQDGKIVWCHAYYDENDYLAQVGLTANAPG